MEHVPICDLTAFWLAAWLTCNPEGDTSHDWLRCPPVPTGPVKKLLFGQIKTNIDFLIPAPHLADVNSARSPRKFDQQAKLLSGIQCEIVSIFIARLQEKPAPDEAKSKDNE
jgi:hypothetical protein